MTRMDRQPRKNNLFSKTIHLLLGDEVKREHLENQVFCNPLDSKMLNKVE